MPVKGVDKVESLKTGERVRLSEKVRHAEFRGVCGTVERTVKSRGVVVVRCDNGKRYDALPENIELLREEAL